MGKQQHRGHAKVIRTRGQLTLLGGGTQYVPLTASERVEAGIGTQAEIEAYLLETANRQAIAQQQAASREARLQAAAQRRADADADAKAERIKQARELATAVNEPTRPSEASEWVGRYVHVWDDALPEPYLDDEGCKRDALAAIDATYKYRPMWQHARVDQAYASRVAGVHHLELWIYTASWPHRVYTLSDSVVLIAEGEQDRPR